MSDFTITMNSDDPPNSFTEQTSDDVCRACGVGLVYAGKGRHPQWCDDHKPNNRASVKPSADLRQIEESIADMYRMLAMGVGMVSDDDAMEIAAHADKLAASWVALARTNPKVKKFLMRMSTGSGVSAVLMAHGAVAFPIMARHGLIPGFAKRR